MSYYHMFVLVEASNSFSSGHYSIKSLFTTVVEHKSYKTMQYDPSSRCVWLCACRCVESLAFHGHLRVSISHCTDNMATFGCRCDRKSILALFALTV